MHQKSKTLALVLAATANAVSLTSKGQMVNFLNVLGLDDAVEAIEGLGESGIHLFDIAGHGVSTGIDWFADAGKAIEKGGEDFLDFDWDVLNKIDWDVIADAMKEPVDKVGEVVVDAAKEVGTETKDWAKIAEELGIKAAENAGKELGEIDYAGWAKWAAENAARAALEEIETACASGMCVA